MKGLKESFRKLLVSLKRRPHMIPLLVFALAFLVYSLNLMNISDTTAKIQGKGMGLCGFATMLFSLLSLLCFLNAFPHRKKVNVPMLVLAFLMMLLLQVGLCLDLLIRKSNKCVILNYLLFT